jgi:molybdate transport system substrate-binding protein
VRPADVFLSADEKWMDDVGASGSGSQGLLVPGSRQDLLANELVLIAPAGKRLTIRFESSSSFGAQLPDIKKIAVGDPSHVPAGRYAKQAWNRWDGGRRCRV